MLPLPEFVPIPTSHQLGQLNAMGITFSDHSRGFAKMRLPSGWTFNDTSYRYDLPIWVIVDTANMIRAYVCGAWKGLYDNELYFEIASGNDVYVPRTTKPDDM